MATKTKLHGPHSAGIYADLSVDGPEIGTLVAVVDRARNLPNRKTIGKQDPYCAARLGKEAKKTATDVRGGQTPRWDQELRFKVHDSPDYYQLKISVFTDDKRTDLIGEAWVDLKGIIVPGGGQNDLWQTLNCRGKYAGELRIEITFYDTRPKPEKPVAKPRPQPAAYEQEAGGSVKQRGGPAPTKRRPLPSDPVTGEAPPVSQPAPAPVAPADPYHNPPRAHARQPSHNGYVPNQSPLQSVEYQTPPSGARYGPPQDYSPSPLSSSRGDAYRQTPPQGESYDTPPPPRNYYDEREHSSRGTTPTYYPPDPRGQPPQQPPPPPQDHYDRLPPREDPRQFPPADGPPPPPPAHRTAVGGGSFDAQKMPMRHDVLKNEAQRHTMAAYPDPRPSYGRYGSAPPEPTHPQQQQGPAPGYEPAIPRPRSYEPPYDPRTMQATVEDAPESPGGPYGDPYRYADARMSRPDEMSYDRGLPPASRSPGASPLRHSPSPRDVPPDDYSYSTSPGHGHYGNAGQHPPKAMPDLPPSLVPGIDPSLSQELAERVNQERRYERRYTTQNVGTPPRGRPAPPEAPPQSYGPPDTAGSPYGQQQPVYDRRSGAEMIPAHSQGNSPQRPGSSSQHMIKRKSVSPAPSPVEERRASDVPFGPDSFDAFNTSMTSTAPIDHPDGKIVMYDGREVDPSDHLPVESWAPEPEPRQPQNQPPPPEPRARPSPSGAQPMPPSGRRQLRVAPRPQTLPAPPPTRPSYGPQEPPAPVTPSSGGRNRLHKKSRPSATQSPAADSSPLAPISPGNYQDPYTPTRGGAYRQPQLPQPDYPNENYAPPPPPPQQQQQAHYVSAPPVPAKEPLHQGYPMSGANGPDASLMYEMQRIDIGAGPSRRRGGY